MSKWMTGRLVDSDSLGIKLCICCRIRKVFAYGYSSIFSAILGPCLNVKLIYFRFKEEHCQPRYNYGGTLIISPLL